MEILVRARGLNEDEVPREDIDRRIRSAVDRFEPRIAEITVLLSDLNGPRGGVDKLCTMSAGLASGGEVKVREKQPNLMAAVSRAAHRLNARIASRLESKRERDSVRYSPPPAA